MIKISEIQKKAREVGVRDQQIEKDYILSWLLMGISQHELLSKLIVFKGGTVLKKVYFEDYRFSEDLDFTLIENQISNEKIFGWIKEIFQFIKEEANIPMEVIDNNNHEDGGINFYISYIGPLGGTGNNKKVKVDISRNEKMIFKPESKDVILGYTDITAHSLLCYSLNEVMIEKMRTVMQRMQPRDLYDIWYLFEVHEIDMIFYMNEFQEKCNCKGIIHSNFPQKLTERIPQYKNRWIGSMSDQIKDLPDFDQVERVVQRHIKKLKF